jgi:hypothetical protein
MVQAGKINVPWGALLTMERYGEVEVHLHAFLTSAIDLGKRSVSRPSHYPPGESALGVY